MIGQKQVSLFYQSKMPKDDGNKSSEEFIISYLNKNKNFFIKHPDLAIKLNYPLKDKSYDKVVDLETYRYKKISRENIELQNQITQILLAGKSHISSQKKILKSSLRILNTKSLIKLIEVIISDLKIILGCNNVNCFFSNKSSLTKSSSLIDNKIASSYFRDGKKTYLNQNPKGILIFFPNQSRTTKSYILLKAETKNGNLIIAMGSNASSKFTPDQQVDLIEYLTKIIEIKISNFELQ